tara:strand:+ start:718 stop:1653 length:936 start_codon:yes stop_codon:yes gene_type:complete
MGRKKGLPINGWLILDKPLEMSSTQALSKARYILNARKAGHAGTLDPAATGVLPLAFGEATKTVSYFQAATKTYRFTARWGAATNTDDAEGEFIQTSDSRPSEEQVQEAARTLTGEISQVPPQYSAIKVKGERAYALARKGEDVKLSARKVFVLDLRLLSHTGEESEFECHCSKGTYIRSLARDMGESMGCFGHVTALRRTAVGQFTENDAFSLDELEKIVQSAPTENVLLPVEAPLDDIPALYITDNEASRLKNGQSVVLFSKDGQRRMKDAGLDPKSANDTVLARTYKKPIALVDIKGVEMKPVRVLNV